MSKSHERRAVPLPRRTDTLNDGQAAQHIQATAANGQGQHLSYGCWQELVTLNGGELAATRWLQRLADAHTVPFLVELAPSRALGEGASSMIINPIYPHSWHRAKREQWYTQAALALSGGQPVVMVGGDGD